MCFLSMGVKKQDRELNLIAERDHFIKLWLTHLINQSINFPVQGIAAIQQDLSLSENYIKAYTF